MSEKYKHRSVDISMAVGREIIGRLSKLINCNGLQNSQAKTPLCQLHLLLHIKHHDFYASTPR